MIIEPGTSYSRKQCTYLYGQFLPLCEATSSDFTILRSVTSDWRRLLAATARFIQFVLKIKFFAGVTDSLLLQSLFPYTAGLLENKIRLAIEGDYNFLSWGSNNTAHPISFILSNSTATQLVTVRTRNLGRICSSREGSYRLSFPKNAWKRDTSFDSRKPNNKRAIEVSLQTYTLHLRWTRFVNSQISR